MKKQSCALLREVEDGASLVFINTAETADIPYTNKRARHSTHTPSTLLAFFSCLSFIILFHVQIFNQSDKDKDDLLNMRELCQALRTVTEDQITKREMDFIVRVLELADEAVSDVINWQKMSVAEKECWGKTWGNRHGWKRHGARDGERDGEESAREGALERRGEMRDEGEMCRQRWRDERKRGAE